MVISKNLLLKCRRSWGKNHSNLKTIIFKLVKNMFKIIIDLSIYIYQIDINQLWTTGIQSIGPADTQVTSGIDYLS
jgi:hypothetical protein